MTPTPSFLPGAALLVSGGGCAPQASPWGSGKGSEAPGYCRLGSQKADPGWSLASMKFFKVCPWGQQLRKERKGTGLDRGRVQLGGRLTPPGVARRAPKLGQGGWNLNPPRPPPLLVTGCGGLGRGVTTGEVQWSPGGGSAAGGRVCRLTASGRECPAVGRPGL